MRHDRVEVSNSPLDVASLYQWALSPECGAVVLFSGVVRDHAEDRTGVTSLTYEAYGEIAKAKLQDVIDEARRRFPTLGRVALVHRLGELQLSESSVMVVVSAPHRPEAFNAARFCIDALKQSVPIWKKEEWSSGSDWGTNAVNPVSVSSVDSTSMRASS
jgi:molybdopterin synthase catalytic subunit